MTPSQANSTADSRQDPFRWQRLDSAQSCADFLAPDARCSQRHFAQQHGIPRSTLGYWLRRQAGVEADGLEAELVAFLKSPVGERFLHRLVHAALLIFQQAGPCGIRTVGHFLELAQLDRFVGSSYGALQPLARAMQGQLAAFDDEERPRLAAAMPRRDIALCADENFHGPHACLVAIEPVSNFILVETYAPRRDGPTWSAAIEKGLLGLPVTVVLLCSDRAKGLLNCAADGLQSMHSSDVFHHQSDLAKPLVAPLSKPLREAHKDLREAKAQTERLGKACEDAAAAPPRRGRPVDYFGRALQSARQEVEAQQAIEEAEKQLEEALAPLRGLADDYHPFDRHSGEAVRAEQLRRRLEQRLGQLEAVVEQAGLSEQAAEKVKEARSWLVAWVGCMAWFWATVRQRLEQLPLDEEGERLTMRLMAGYYWEASARRARTPEERERLRQLSEGLQKEAWGPRSVLAELPEQEQDEVKRVARQCAGLFARSSSCVEGRNGRLSLHHHGQTRLSEGRLRALTVLHNYLSRRSDGTTAAERFFGQKPRDLFTWLLERLPELPRPATKRPKKAA
jgi:hypothetical protein